MKEIAKATAKFMGKILALLGGIGILVAMQQFLNLQLKDLGKVVMDGIKQLFVSYRNRHA